MGRLSVNNAASCGVCGSTGTATNQLVFCVRCNACQHRSCGGLIPTVGEEEDEDEFFCVACTANRDSAPRRRSRSRSRARNCELTLSCALCKQTSTTRLPFTRCKEGVSDAASIWLHVGCARVALIPFDGQVLSTRASLERSLQKISRSEDPNHSCQMCGGFSGALLSCKRRSCDLFAHPSCAVLEQIEIGHVHANGKFVSRYLCREHSSDQPWPAGIEDQMQLDDSDASNYIGEADSSDDEEEEEDWDEEEEDDDTDEVEEEDDGTEEVQEEEDTIAFRSSCTEGVVVSSARSGRGLFDSAFSGFCPLSDAERQEDVEQRRLAYRKLSDTLRRKQVSSEHKDNVKLFERLLSNIRRHHKRHRNEDDEVLQLYALNAGVNAGDQQQLFAALQQHAATGTSPLCLVCLQPPLVRSVNDALHAIADAVRDHKRNVAAATAAHEPSSFACVDSSHDLESRRTRFRARQESSSMEIDRTASPELLSSTVLATALRKHSNRAEEQLSSVLNTSNARKLPIVVVLERVESLVPAVLNRVLARLAVVVRRSRTNHSDGAGVRLSVVLGVSSTDLNSLERLLSRCVLERYYHLHALDASAFGSHCARSLLKDIFLRRALQPLTFGPRVLERIRAVAMSSVGSVVASMRFAALQHYSSSALSNMWYLFHSEQGSQHQQPASMQFWSEISTEQIEFLSSLPSMQGSDDIAAAAVYSYRILLEYEYFFLFCLQVSERRLSRSYTWMRLYATLNDASARVDWLESLGRNLRQCPQQDMLRELKCWSAYLGTSWSSRGFVEQVEEIIESSQRQELQPQTPQPAALSMKQRRRQSLSHVSNRTKQTNIARANDAISLLCRIVTDHVPLLKQLPMHELFYFDDVNALNDVFPCNTGARVVNALRDPMSVCSDSSSGNLNCKPDLSILLNIVRESGSFKANLSSCLTAFKAQLSGPDHMEDEVELQSRFMQAVDELRQLGLIKLSSRSRGCIERLCISLD